IFPATTSSAHDVTGSSGVVEVLLTGVFGLVTHTPKTRPRTGIQAKFRPQGPELRNPARYHLGRGFLEFAVEFDPHKSPRNIELGEPRCRADVGLPELLLALRQLNWRLEPVVVRLARHRRVKVRDRPPTRIAHDQLQMGGSWL